MRKGQYRTGANGTAFLPMYFLLEENLTFPASPKGSDLICQIARRGRGLAATCIKFSENSIAHTWTLPDDVDKI